MGVFGDWAEKYFESGLSIMPVDGKRGVIKSWTDLCKRLPTEKEIEQWVKQYPHLNIGLCTGEASRVVAVDIDTDDEKAIKIIKDILPPTPVAKKGKKGITYFYLYDGEQSVEIKSNGIHLIDILSNGRQTVIPPSIHPVVDAPYEWVAGRSLIDFMEDLPRLGVEIINNLDRAINGISIEDVSSEKSGRNNALKSYVCAIIEKFDTDTVVKKAIEYDLAFHDKPLFEDKKECKSDSPEVNAFEFVSNIKKFVLKQQKQKSKDLSAKRLDDDAIMNEAIKNGFYEPVVNENTEKITFVPQYEIMAKYFAQKYKIKNVNGRCHLYNGKNYDYASDEQLSSIICKLLKDQYKPARTTQFLKAVKDFNFVAGEKLQSPDGFLNLENGILNVSTGELVPHSDKYNFTYKIGISFDKNAKCPTWDNCLNFIFNENKNLIKASQLCFGYCIQGGEPWLHKALFLYGSGRNGKSTWIYALENLVGKENISNVSLTGLTRPFSVVMADGKLVNSITEGETKDLSSEAFKNSVAGENMIAAHKGKPEYSMPWRARQIIALNNFPNFKDSSDGSIERFYIIPFNRFIPEGQRDANIKKKLLNDLPGILNWAVAGLKELLELKKLPVFDEQKAVLEEYRESTDSCYQWFKAYVRPSAAENTISFSEFYDHYASWCSKEGRHPVSKIGFSRNLIRYAKRAFDTEIKARDTFGRIMVHGNISVTATSNLGLHGAPSWFS